MTSRRTQRSSPPPSSAPPPRADPIPDDEQQRLIDSLIAENIEDSARHEMAARKMLRVASMVAFFVFCDATKTNKVWLKFFFDLISVVVAELYLGDKSRKRELPVDQSKLALFAAAAGFLCMPWEKWSDDRVYVITMFFPPFNVLFHVYMRKMNSRMDVEVRKLEELKYKHKAV